MLEEGGITVLHKQGTVSGTVMSNKLCDDQNVHIKEHSDCLLEVQMRC
jgi:hypothetical protein